MKKNVAGQRVGAQMVSATDGGAFTGAVTVRVTGDAGTQAVGSVGSGACAHEGNGYHTYAPAQAETNYDLIAFTFTGSGAVPMTLQVYPSFPQTGDAFTLIGATGSGLTTLATQASVNTIDDFLDTEIAAILARLPAALTGAGNIKADALAIDGSTTAAVNLKQSASAIHVGSVTGAATATTLVDSSLTQSATDHWKGRILIFLTGTLAKQATDITAFTPGTDTLTFTALTGAPSTSDTYVIL